MTTPSSFPISDPVLIVALAMLIFLVAPLVFDRLRVPGIIGVIVAGVAVGPNALNLLELDSTIVLLGTVGLLYLMFMAGVEIDLHGFQKYRRRSLIFGAITFLVPQLVGTAVFLWLGFGWAASILIASMFASHTLVAYPIVSRLGIAKNEAVTTTVGGTILTDTAALLVLAVVAASVEGDLNLAFWASLGVALSAYVAVLAVGLPRLGRWFFRNQPPSGASGYIFVLAVLFGAAYLARLAGIEPIVGAFLAGLLLNRLIPEQSPLNNRIHFFGNAFFIPFFLLYIGMLVDVRVLTGSAEAWLVMTAMLGTNMVTKKVAALVTQRLFRYTAAERWVMWGLSTTEAAATLAATLVGYQIGLLDDTVLNGVILMILVTCIVGPWTVGRFGRRVALQEEHEPYRPSEAPQRILIPMANPATAEDLMDLAFLIRDPSSPDPLHPLTVVRSGTEEAAAQVAEAEKMLSHAVCYAAGAEIPVTALTRVDDNYPAAIVRAMIETRTSTMVIGWDGRRRHGIFGSVLDRVLERSSPMVLVAKLGHRLNTTRRLIVLLPPGADHERGFFGAVETVKTMAHRLGSEIVAITVGEPAEPYGADFEAVRPDAPISFERAASWSDVLPELERLVEPDDLVVVLSARQGTVAWTRELDRLPGQLARLAPESFVMLYPSLMEGVRNGAGPVEEPDVTLPDGVVVDMPASSLSRAIDRLLETVPLLDGPVRRAIAVRLVDDQAGFTEEVGAGSMLLHARLRGLTEPLLLLGTSREGIQAESRQEPVHVLFLMLSPAEQPETHLRRLSEVARLMHDEEHLRQLRDSRSTRSVFDWIHAAAD